MFLLFFLSVLSRGAEESEVPKAVNYLALQELERDIWPENKTTFFLMRKVYNGQLGFSCFRLQMSFFFSLIHSFAGEEISLPLLRVMMNSLWVDDRL